MTAAADLLDKYKKARSLASDMAAADSLGVTRALVSKWRNGGRQPQEAEIETMCRATGEDEGVWLTLLAAERAETPAARTSLLRMVDLAKKYGHAACLVLALGVPSHDANAHAAPARTDAGFSTAPSIHYAQLRMGAPTYGLLG